MTRDYSQFFPNLAKPGARPRSELETLGWQPFFAQQISASELVETPPARVTEVHRNGLQIRGAGIDQTIPPIEEATVGDWLMLTGADPAQSRVLGRKSLFQRRAPGTTRARQLIAANIETALIVTSCNADFNIARLERYIALAFEAGVTPVIVLTKTDLCDDPAPYVAAAQAISDKVAVVALNALGAGVAEALALWCKPGQTVAFLGSSGVGKSTLVNTLCGVGAETAPIREDDARGRHTTTRRQLHPLPGGGMVLDTPGMRELQMTDAESGIADLFDDLTALAAQCRFNDCRHDSEPGCAVTAALSEGTIDAARLARWRKLTAEDRFNSASLSERKADAKSLQKRIRASLRHKRGTRE